MSDSICIADEFQIVLRRSRRARRMTLRVPKTGGNPVLTLPHRASINEARAFAEAQHGWLRQACARQVQLRDVVAGASLPIRGRLTRIRPSSQSSGPGIRDETLLIPADRPVGPVVAGFLKHLALQELRPACDGFAALLGREYRAITLRDTRSRWGSCSAQGRLMFSWRLAMAPDEVLRYVAAHEVAHLVHMDHSPRFWATVETLMPDYERPRHWLRQEGNGLFAWRFRD